MSEYSSIVLYQRTKIVVNKISFGGLQLKAEEQKFKPAGENEIVEQEKPNLVSIAPLELEPKSVARKPLSASEYEE